MRTSGRCIWLWFASVERAFTLQPNEHMIRHLSLTLGELAHSIVKAGAAQQWPRNSWAKVVRDYHRGLNYLLAEPWGICVIVNTGIISSGEVETQWHKIREQAHWLQVSSNSPHSFDLFGWLPSGPRSQFRTIIQFEIVTLFLIMFCKIILKLSICCLSRLCRNNTE